MLDEKVGAAHFFHCYHLSPHLLFPSRRNTQAAKRPAMNKQLLMAINQICAERNLKPQVVIDAVEQALVSAYRRNFGSGGNVEAKLDPETGDMRIYARMEVVAEDEITDPKAQLTPAQAAEIDPTKTKPGDEVFIERTPDDFGRIAAQTAKQVILQRIREAERDAVYDDYVDREGELVQGVVRSIDHASGGIIIALDGGRAEGILNRPDQIPGERYRNNASVLAYVSEVAKGTRGPAIHLSRTHRNMLRRLLEKEVPEIKQGVVEIKAIAREAGARSKVAVSAVQPGVDPVGSCVGMRGVRIQNIVNELGGEKIDVIEWHHDPERFVANALSPARVTDVLLFPEHDRTAVVVVPDNQLSLAIGKEGQNARLVAKLTGWRIDIKNESEATSEGLDEFERHRMRIDRKDRSHADDLLEAARRILAESNTDLLAEAQAELDVMPVAAEPAEARLEAEAAPAEAQAVFQDVLSQVELPVEEVPSLDALDALLALAAPEYSQAAAPMQEPLTASSDDVRDLAAKLALAMSSLGEGMVESGQAVDRKAFARLIAAGDDVGNSDRDSGPGGKKMRKKDRRAADQRASRPVAKPPKPKTDSSGKVIDYNFDDEFDE